MNQNPEILTEKNLIRPESKVFIDTEGTFSDGLKGAKVLVVGKDDLDTASLLRAIKETGAKVVVVDSYAKPFSHDLVPPMIMYKPDWCNPDLLPDVNRIHRFKTVKPKTKCGLPGCDVVSERDYCSAEHCRKHKGKV